MQNNKKLGRGLGGLIGLSAPVQVEVPAATSKPPAPAAVPQPIPVSENPDSTSVRQVDVTQIVPSPYQPRRVMDDDAIARLTESIKHSGVMQPIVVRERAGKFELVVGERRWRAAQAAGLSTIPATVRILSDELAAEWALVENVQREDLNSMERAWALRSLTEKFRLTQQQVSDRVGLDRTTVTNLIRLTEIEPEIAEMITRSELSAGHGRALLALPPGTARKEMAAKAVGGEWSVRRLEQEVKLRLEPAPKMVKVDVMETSAGREAVVTDLERRLAEYLGTKVKIQADATGKRGKLMIEFYGLEHFDGLMHRIGMPTR